MKLPDSTVFRDITHVIPSIISVSSVKCTWIGKKESKLHFIFEYISEEGSQSETSASESDAEGSSDPSNIGTPIEEKDDT